MLNIGVRVSLTFLILLSRKTSLDVAHQGANMLLSFEIALSFLFLHHSHHMIDNQFQLEALSASALIAEMIQGDYIHSSKYEHLVCIFYKQVKNESFTLQFLVPGSVRYLQTECYCMPRLHHQHFQFYFLLEPKTLRKDFLK